MRTLEITTKIGCSNRCDFCPQDKLLRVYKGNKLMGFAEFDHILSNTPKDVILDFTGFCEPFLNHFTSSFILTASELGYKMMLITTLAGFNYLDAKALSHIEFIHVWIHEYNEAIIDENFERKAGMLKNAVVTDDFKRFKLPKENQYSRAGNLWDIEKKKGKFECGWSGREFYRNVVLPNGDVYLCCMDYGLEQKIGNLFETNYNDLDRESIIQKSMQKDSEIICRKCEIARYED